MATKKRKAPAKKAVRKKAPRRRAAAAPAAAPSAVQSAPRRNGLWLALLILGLLLAVIWRGQRKFSASDDVQAPEGRSPAVSVPAGPAEEPAAQPTARRETAGETGEPSLTFDRGEQESLSVRCWRPAGGQARLDIFGPRNQRVRTLTSESGEAGWQSLRWDGKDEAGSKVPAGLYYVRPSAKDLQQVRDVWVKG